MSTGHTLDPSRSINVASPILVNQLNQLLTSLGLEIVVESPRDLTPSLLIIIVEALLSSRLPIPSDQRSAIFSSASAKVYCMKIFLGVLQADILRQDVGLGNIDPHLLAKGADTETIFVGRLLCWYGRRIGLVSRRSGGDDRRGAASPSTLTTTTKRTSPVHVFSSTPLGTIESNTTVSDDQEADQGPSHSPAEEPPGVFVPRCIHEVSTPSSFSTHLPSEHSPQNTTVRYTGYIELVDEASEIAVFEARRAEEKHAQLGRLGKHRQQASVPEETPLPDVRRIRLCPLPSLTCRQARSLANKCAQAHKRKVEVLRKKADLLEELARLQVSEYYAALQDGG
jgi:hypothetical protein